MRESPSSLCDGEHSAHFQKAGPLETFIAVDSIAQNANNVEPSEFRYPDPTDHERARQRKHQYQRVELKAANKQDA